MQDSRTVYCGNVPATVDEDTLRSIFENAGRVTDVRIAGKKGLHTVYCFIEFSEPSEAHTALAMDGLKVGDRQIRCSLAKSDQRPALPPPPQAMPMLGQPFNLMQAQAQARLMQQLPAFNMLLGPLPGAPPVVDSRGKAAQRPPQDPDRVARTIFVESVADNMNEQAIAEFFTACGEVIAVRLSAAAGQKKAWVEFNTKDAARSAREYDNTMMGPATVRHRGALEAQKRSAAMAGLPSLHQQHQAAAQQQRYMLPPHQGMADPLMLAEAQRRAAMLGPHEQRQLLEAQLRGMQDPNSMFGRSSDIMSMSTAAMLHLQQQRGGGMGGPLMDPLMAMSRQMDPAAHQLSLQQRQLYSTLMGLPPQMLESHLASLQAAFMPRHYARGVGNYPESGRRSPPNLQNPMPSKRQRMH
eukprot:jgi/Astpho2/8471/Aster-x1521